jgi:hypothetical protein
MKSPYYPTKFVIVGNEIIAKNEYKLWNYRGVEFVPQDDSCTFFSEKEFLFSRAISKFQHLVIFEDA